MLTRSILLLAINCLLAGCDNAPPTYTPSPKQAELEFEVLHAGMEALIFKNKDADIGEWSRRVNYLRQLIDDPKQAGDWNESVLKSDQEWLLRAMQAGLSKLDEDKPGHDGRTVLAPRIKQLQNLVQ